MNKTELVKKLFNIKVFFGALIVIICLSYLSFSGNAYTLKVNENETINPPVEVEGEIYVPLNEIVDFIGGESDYNSKKGKLITVKKDGTKVIIKNLESKAIVGKKVIPLATTEMNGTIVPLNTKSIIRKSQMYVPFEFVFNSNSLNIPIQVVNIVENKTVQKKEVSSNTSELKEQKDNTNKNTDDWKAPVLKSKWSADPSVNYRTLVNELGFTNGGSRYALPEYPQGIIHVVEQGGKNIDLVFFTWKDSALPNSYRVPVVAKELFKLYFAKDADRVWNYCENGNIPDNFTANGFKVKVVASSATGAVSFMLR